MARSSQPPAGAGSVRTSLIEGDLWLATGVLAIATFLPTAVFYLWGTPSHATGVVIAAALIGGIYAMSPERTRPRPTFENWVVVAILITIAVAAHLLVGSLLQPKELQRALLSLPVLAALLVGGYVAYSLLRRVTDLGLNQAIAIIRAMFVVAAVFGVAGLQPASASELVSNEKSVFPFAEPSHFAVAFSPFLIHAGVAYRGWKQLFWIAVGFALAYLLKNLSLAVASTLTALLCLPLSRLVPAGLALIAVVGVLDIEYFTDRLDFGARTTNVSVLVYRQGWELAVDALQRTTGFGVGFQQLGYAPFNSPSADMLYRILHSDSNILDGGFLAAKVLSEFGAFGLFLLGCYVLFATQAGLGLRAHALRRKALPAKAMFAAAIVCGFAIELFVRGLGYFSGSAMLFVSGILMLRDTRAPSTLAITTTPFATPDHVAPSEGDASP